jgi:hypothetical protein
MYYANRFDVPAMNNTTAPSPDTSARYNFIPTPEILDVLEQHGFSIISASQGMSKSPYARHRVELTHDSFKPFEVVPGDVVSLRATLFNSHNRRAGFCLHTGAYRACCANGMVFGANATANTIKFRHQGKFDDDFIEGVYRIVDDSKNVLTAMRGMADIQLTAAQQAEFATKALTLRWKGTPPVEVTDVLQPRRIQDVGDSLWLTYQRVQESLVKGGMLGRTQSNKVQSVRALKSITKDQQINTKLWDLATEFAEAV